MAASKSSEELNKLVLVCRNNDDLNRYRSSSLASAFVDGEGAVDFGTATDVDGSDAYKSLQFDIAKFFRLLKTDELGRTLVYGDRVTSTQTLMKEKLLALGPGTVFTATTQVMGKGRGPNTWESPLGCLMFTVKCVVDTATMLPFVQYLVSVAMVEAIKGERGCESLDVKIKWPNDVYGDKAKLGGTISTSELKNGKYEVLCGTGINVDNLMPTTCLNEILAKAKAKSDGGSSLQEATPFSRESVLASFLNRFEGALRVFNSKGFDPFLESYLHNWMHTDQKVIVTSKTHQQKEMTIIGLTSTGYLKAVDDFGKTEELHPDGNSLDMMRGLITTKEFS